MPLLYDLGTGLYHLAVRVVAPFVPKARQWVDGRKGIWERLEAVAPQLHGCVWMHCASVGEFEQGLPVLEGIRSEHPGIPVLVTFFSPSGYEARKDHPIATHVEYLPPDGAANARRLLKLVQPCAALFVRYEFWYHHLDQLAQRGVPTFLLSGTFRADQPFFRWYGRAHQRMVRMYRHIFVQDEPSRTLLATIGVTAVTVAGDTRFDRVAGIVAAQEDLPIATAFKGSHALLVCGSSWPRDEQLILDAGVPFKYMVVPHELSASHLLSIERTFPKPLARWSELEGGPAGNIAAVLGEEPQGTLLVDRMGLLARLYRVADIAYVGGGFGDGIHSLLEAAAWGKPVIFGPNHRKFVEAFGLIEAGAGFAVSDARELGMVLQKFRDDPEALARASAAAASYVQQRIGATRNTLQGILPVIGNDPANDQ